MTGITGNLNLDLPKSYKGFDIPPPLIIEAIKHPKKLIKLLPTLNLRIDEKEPEKEVSFRKAILIIAMLNTSKPGRLYLILDKIKKLGINNEGESVAKEILLDYEEAKIVLKKQTVFELAKHVKLEQDWSQIYNNLTEEESKKFFGKVIANSFKIHGEHWAKLLKNDPKIDREFAKKYLIKVINDRRMIALRKAGL